MAFDELNRKMLFGKTLDLELVKGIKIIILVHLKICINWLYQDVPSWMCISTKLNSSNTDYLQTKMHTHPTLTPPMTTPGEIQILWRNLEENLQLQLVVFHTRSPVDTATILLQMKEQAVLCLSEIWVETFDIKTWCRCLSAMATLRRVTSNVGIFT